MLLSNLIEPEPSVEPLVAVRASLVEMAGDAGVVAGLFGQAEQLAVVDADGALDPLHLGAQQGFVCRFPRHL